LQVGVVRGAESAPASLITGGQIVGSCSQQPDESIHTDIDDLDVSTKPAGTGVHPD
jgi:hypothetical protein